MSKPRFNYYTPYTPEIHKDYFKEESQLSFLQKLPTKEDKIKVGVRYHKDEYPEAQLPHPYKVGNIYY